MLILEAQCDVDSSSKTATAVLGALVSRNVSNEEERVGHFRKRGLAYQIKKL